MYSKQKNKQVHHTMTTRTSAILGRKKSLFSVASLMVVGAFAFIMVLRVNAADAVVFNSDFEADTTGWAGSGSITRVSSGTDGVASSGGGYHAIVDGSPVGPNTQLGGYSSTWPGEWKTSIDIYLDPAWDEDTGFNYAVATNNVSGVGLRDFVFQAGVLNDESTEGVAQFVALADTSGSGTSNPLKHIKDMPANRRAVITSADWYTIEHSFRNIDGRLIVTVTLLDSSDTVIKSWNLGYEWVNDLIPDTVGGNRYGWFSKTNVPSGIAIDNVTRSITRNQYSVDTNASAPAEIILDEGKSITLLGVTAGAITTPVQVAIAGAVNNVQVIIPQGTEITAADNGWDGSFDAPVAESISSVNVNGKDAVVSAAFKVGGVSPLEFSKAVKVILPGQAGKNAGYIDSDNVFHNIPTVCAADPEATLVGIIKECYVSDGDDLVIWTKHFTIFLAYSNVPGAPDTGMATPANLAVVIGLFTAGATIFTVTVVAFRKKQTSSITSSRR